MIGNEKGKEYSIYFKNKRIATFIGTGSMKTMPSIVAVCKKCRGYGRLYSRKYNPTRIIAKDCPDCRKKGGEAA